MDTKKLRQKILDLAIRGKLVPQDPNDEPASILLERIHAEKERLIQEGKIKRSKKFDSDTLKNKVPFEIPESWVWATLGEISNYGITTNVDVKDIPQNAWVLELEDLEKDSATIIKRITKGEREIKGVRHSFKKGDVLYSKLRTYLNKVLVAPEDGYCTTEIIPISLCSYIQSSYLNQVLRSKFFLEYTIQCGYGVKMPRLSTTDACKGQIPLPPLNVQKRIVAAIEQWFSLIDILENEKSALQASIQQAKSKILGLAIHGKLVPQDPNDEPAIELLKRINPKYELDDIEHEELPEGWEVVSFQIVCDTISSKPYQILQSEIKSYGKIPVISQSANYIEGYSDREDCILKVEKPILIFGDHTRVLKYVDFDFMVGADGVKLLQTSLLTKYVYYVLLHTIHNIQNKGYARHYSILSKTQIPIPPHQEQLRIVAKIEELFAILDDIKESLE